MVLWFFIIPGFNASYHSFDANGNTIVVSFNYSMLELMTEARTLIDFLEIISFESIEARSGVPTFFAWVVSVGMFFCIAILVRYIYILLKDVEKSIDAGKFSLNMVILLSVLMVAVAYFMNPISFEAPIRIFGLGTSLSPAHQFSFSMFPFLIVQYIIIILAIFARVFIIKKLEDSLSVYSQLLREQNSVLTVKTWDCDKCNKTNFYYNIKCRACGDQSE
jgi:hypothetical protein